MVAPTNLDDVHSVTRKLEDALFDQAKFMDQLPESDPRRATLDETSRASHAGHHHQVAMENAHGKPEWAAAKTKAIEFNKKARKILQDNVRRGVGGWQVDHPIDGDFYRAQLREDGLL
jgi:hypothetical protein